DAATRFHESPDLAILQHKSSFIRITHNYLERVFIYFNELIYAFIGYTVVSGDIGTFLGYYLFSLHSANLGATPLFVGRHCRRCHGLKMDQGNGGQKPMYLKTLR